MIKIKLTPFFLKKEGMKIISIAAVAMMMAVGLASSASAANLSWSANTTIVIGSAEYSISSGSASDTLVINPTTLQVNVPALSTLTLTSNNGYDFTLNDATGAVESCSGGSSILTITGAGVAQTITPVSTTINCVAASGGGGGGAPAPTPSPSVSPTPTPSATPTPTPNVLPGPTTPASPSGVTLYRAEGDNRVYVVKDGKKSWIKTAEEFNSKGYKWTNIVVISAAAMASYPDDTAPVSSVGAVALYRADGDFKVYAVANGVKQWIKTAAEFNSKGYKWTNIVVTSPETVASYPDGVVASATVKVVNTATLRVRKSNSTKGAILGSVKRNATFTVLEENAGWYKITLPSGVIGWISGLYAAKQ